MYKYIRKIFKNNMNKYMNSAGGSCTCVVFLVLLRFVALHFCKKNIHLQCESQFLQIAARLEPYAVTKVSHCILIFHSVNTFSLPVP